MTFFVPNPLPISHHTKRTKPDEIRLIVLVAVVFIGEMLLWRRKHRRRLLVRRIHQRAKRFSKHCLTEEKEVSWELCWHLLLSSARLIRFPSLSLSRARSLCLSFASSPLMMMSSMMCWMTYKIINHRFVSTQCLFFEWKRPRRMRSLIGALFPSECVLSIDERRTHSR